MRALSNSLHDLYAQLLELLTHDLEDFASLACDSIGPWALGASGRVGLGREPAIALHAFEQGIERAGADLVTVMPQLLEHPLAHHITLRRVMQDMDLPEREEDLAVEEFALHGDDGEKWQLRN